MKELHVIDKLDSITHWLTNNQWVIIHYTINILLSSIIMLIGIIFSKTIPHGSKKIMHARNIDRTITDFFSSIIRYTIIIFTVIFSLECIGVHTTSIIAVIGTAGLTIGLALQSTLSNFASGILLVSFRYFRSGDHVDFNGTSGIVMVVNLFSTKLRTLDGKIIIVPNNKILSGNITNFSEEPNRLTDIMISVNNKVDITLVKNLITNILEADNRVLRDKGIVIHLKSLNESSLIFIIHAWVPQSELKYVSSDLLEQIKVVFENNRISISSR